MPLSHSAKDLSRFLVKKFEKNSDWQIVSPTTEATEISLRVTSFVQLSKNRSHFQLRFLNRGGGDFLGKKSISPNFERMLFNQVEALNSTEGGALEKKILKGFFFFAKP